MSHAKASRIVDRVLGASILALAAAVFYVLSAYAAGCSSAGTPITQTVPTGAVIPTGSIVNGYATTQPTVATQPTVITTQPTVAQEVNAVATQVQSVATQAQPFAGLVPYGATAVAGILLGAGLVKMLTASSSTPSASTVISDVQAVAGVAKEGADLVAGASSGNTQVVAKEVSAIAGQIAGTKTS